MGLPLFVAPVESDLPSKAADKSRASSPTRSGIRRNARPDSRGRRAMARRHAAIHDRMDVLRQSSNLPTRDLQPLPWVETGFPPDHELANSQPPSRARPFREVLREMARSDERRRERAGDGINSVFGLSWQDEDSATNRGEEDRDVDLGWWTFESRPRFARNRNVTTQQDREPTARSSQGTSAPVENPSSVLVEQQRRRTERRRRELTARAAAIGREQRHLRNVLLHRTRDINGLGDRDRSLSPEVWDTLLTTLTPDPQPPSAGSSFASTAASQNAGVSSNTSITIPDSQNERYLIDPGCDSGCDNSDTEGPYESAYLPRGERRGFEPTRRVRLRVPQRIVDGPVDGPIRTPSNEPDVNLSGSTARQQRSTDDLVAAAVVDGDGPVPTSQNRGSRHGWIGHLSVGTSDDELAMDRRSLNREGSTASAGNLTSQGEDDWSGMQRIVRSLARREDIPDEWWAEAGLSRTLPQDGLE